MKIYLALINLVTFALFSSCSEEKNKGAPVGEITNEEPEIETVPSFKEDAKKDTAIEGETAFFEPTIENGKAIFGDERVPKEWYDSVSSDIKLALAKQNFVLQNVGNQKNSGSYLANSKFRVGVLSVSGEFTSWPGAREQSLGKWGEDYFVLGDPSNIEF